MLKTCFTCALITLFSISFVFTTKAALAQERANKAFAFEDNSVSKPQGLRLQPRKFKGYPKNIGGILVKADTTLSQTYSDNIFASSEGEGDSITTINPDLEIQKNYRRHSFGLKTHAEILRHASEATENRENYKGELYADLEAKRGLDIHLNAQIQRHNVERKTARLQNIALRTKNPLLIDKYGAGVNIEYKPNRLGIDFKTGYEQTRFENAALSSGALSVQKDKDFDLAYAETVLSYDSTTNWQPQLIIRYENQDFKHNIFTNGSFSGNSRTNKALSIVAGARWNYKNLIIGDFAIGQITRQYKDDNINDSKNLAFQGHLIWEPTQKSRFDLNLSRTTIEDNLIIAGLDQSVFDVKLDYELKRNFFGTLLAGYKHEEFSETNRIDNTTRIGLETKYIINPHFQTGLQYTYENRDSDVPASNFKENRMLLYLTGAL